MGTFKLLPSGNWNLRKYDYTDKDGKKHYKSFTARTKADIKRAVIEWESNRPSRIKSEIIVSDALQTYLDTKAPVLSPSTLRGYETI